MKVSAGCQFRRSIPAIFPIWWRTPALVRSPQRDLPWRFNRDPYRIWLSEVMLQQTTVATVIPRFQQFLATFPTLSDLACADEPAGFETMGRAWLLSTCTRLASLGSLARRTSQGEMPDDAEVWAGLPGVGRYILGAVMSQAFDRKMPIVEANSQRVLCRLFGQEGDTKSRSVVDWLWRTAENLLPAKRSETSIRP